MSFSSKVSRGALWAIAGQGSTALLSVLNFAVVGRFVEPAEYGNFLIAMMVLAATQWLAQNAYKEPLIQAPSLTDGQVDSVWTFSLLAGIALCGVMLVAGHYLTGFFSAPLLFPCIAILAARLLLETACSVPAALRMRQLDFRFIARMAMVANLGATVVNIGMLLNGFGLLSLACSQLAVSAISCAALFGTRQRAYRLHLCPHDLAILRGYSPHVITWQAVEAINQTVDRYVIAARLSFGQLGLYGFGKRLNDVVIDVLVGATSSVSLPAFSQLQDDPPRLRAAFLKAMRMVTLMVTPAIAVMFATADDLVPLVFGAKWREAVPVYRCFLLLGVIQTIGILQGALLRSLWKPGTWSIYMLAQCATTVAVIVLFAGHGITVLAAAMVGKTYLLWIWIALRTCRALDLPSTYYLAQLARPLALAGVAAGAGLWLQHVLQGLAPLPRLLANACTVSATFALLALLFLRPAIADLQCLLRNLFLEKFTPLRRAP